MSTKAPNFSATAVTTPPGNLWLIWSSARGRRLRGGRRLQGAVPRGQRLANLALELRIRLAEALGLAARLLRLLPRLLLHHLHQHKQLMLPFYKQMEH